MGCGQSSQSPTGGRVVGSHGSCMSPVPEFVHLLDMYVLLIESPDHSTI